MVRALLSNLWGWHSPATAVEEAPPQGSLEETSDLLVEEMPFSQSPEETVDVIRLHGDLNQAEVNDLLMVLTGCLVEGRHKVVLNFRDVSHISLDGVSRLAERQQIYAALRGEI